MRLDRRASSSLPALPLSLTLRAFLAQARLPAWVRAVAPAQPRSRFRGTRAPVHRATLRPDAIAAQVFAAPMCPAQPRARLPRSAEPTLPSPPFRAPPSAQARRSDPDRTHPARLRWLQVPQEFP